MQITDHVLSLDAARQSHVYAIVQDDGAVLIDTSMPGPGQAIAAEVRASGIDTVKAILLTHHDVDHIGNAALLQDEFGCPVYISATDLDYVTGAKHREKTKRLIGALIKVRPPKDLRPLPEGQLLGVTILPTPGHTPGHTCYLSDGVLFAGDLMSTRDGVLRHSQPIMTWNMPDVLRSVASIKSCGAKWVCPGHGAPVQADAQTVWPDS